MTVIPFFAQEGEMFLKNLSNEAKSKQIKNVLNLVMFLGMTLLFITGASAIIWRLNLQRIPAITAGVPFFWIVSQFIIRCRDTRGFSRERKCTTTKCVGAERIQADMSY